MVQAHFHAQIVFHCIHGALTLVGRFLYLLWLLFILYRSRSLVQLVLCLLLLTLSIRVDVLVGILLLLLVAGLLLGLMIILSLLLLLVCVLHLFLLDCFNGLFVRNGCFVGVFWGFHDNWSHSAILIISLSLIRNVLRHRFLSSTLGWNTRLFLLNYTLICIWNLCLG